MRKARELLVERVVLAENVFAEIRLLEVPKPVLGSQHALKYALALVADRECILRYDNERGKGDHRHRADGVEEPYIFRGIDQLLEDFWKDVDAWMLKEGR